MDLITNQEALLRHKRESGVTLIEILVGLVVGLFILGALTAVMYNSRTNYEISTTKSEMQENARFAMHFLTEDLRHAGFFGCNNKLADSAPVGLVEVEHATKDKIVLRYGSPGDVDVIVDTDIPGNPVPANYAVDVIGDISDWFCPDDALKYDKAVISDCGGSAIVDVAAVDADNNRITISPLTIDEDTTVSPGRWVFEKGPATTIKGLVEVHYDIQTDGDGVPSLRRCDDENCDPDVKCDPELLVEGIENLQFLYRTAGQGQSNNPGWSALQGMQLALLTRTVSHADADPEEGAYSRAVDYGIDRDSRTRTLLDASITPPEIQGSRQSYESMVTRRNN